jgi:aminoglycoside phosphotransferase (APT) family kinase protein
VSTYVNAESETSRFAAALNGHRMGPRLSAALRTPARPCHVLDAKYEPGIRANLLYQHGSDLVRGDLLTDGSPATAVVTDWPGVELSVYPQDPDLPTLPLAISPTEIGARIAALSSSLTPQQRRAFLLRCRVDLLRYRPGKRATVRLTASGAGPGYIGKVYHDSTKAAAVAQEAERLAGDLSRDPTRGGLRLAPTAAHLPDLAVVVQEAVSGQPLDAVLRAASTRPQAACAAVRTAASALAQLHDDLGAGGLISTRQRPVEKELHRFRARASRIAGVDARVGEELLGVAQRLLETFRALPASEVGLVHGDCKPGQFLLAGHGRAYLLDFDHCGISDQAGDAGTFLASLRQAAVQQTLAGASPAATAAWAALGETFLNSYCELRGENLCTRIRWHEIVALQRKALRSFARAPKSPLPIALVEESHRCLDRVTQELS